MACRPVEWPHNAYRRRGAGPDGLVHDKPARNIFQLLGDIFAKGFEITATGIAVVTR